jgi:phosphate transport system protein
VTERFFEQLEQLRRSLILMGAEVERQIQLAIESVTQVDAEKARRVIANDAEIDRMELEIEDLAVQLFACSPNNSRKGSAII